MRGTSKDPATLGHLRLYVLLGFVAVFILVTALDVGSDVAIQDRARLVCEAANDARKSEYGQRGDLIQNASERAADPRTREEGEAALRRAVRRQEQLVEAVVNPVFPGSINRDCIESYPMPFPVNVIRGE